MQNTNPKVLPTERLGELNILLDVLGDEPLYLEAAKSRVLDMASRIAPKFPTPDQYIDVSFQLGLISATPTQIWLTAFGKRIHNLKDPTRPDRLSDEQILVLTPEIMGCPMFLPMIHAAIKLMEPWPGGTRRVPIGQAFMDEEEQGLQLLQVLLLLKYTPEDGGYLSMGLTKTRLLQEQAIEFIATTEEELWSLLDVRRERGKAAEIFVQKFEKQRLNDAGQANLSQLVERVSEHNVGAGYDILSFDVNGEPRYIEVKSSTSGNVRFIWSAGERKQAENLGKAFWIYFVPRTQDLSDTPPEITMINDPFSRIAHNLSETPINYEVKMLGNMGLLGFD
jgi:hypothetical protein